MGMDFVAASLQSFSVGDPAVLRQPEFTWALLVTPTGTITDNAYRPFAGAYNAAGSRSNYTLNMWRSGVANGRLPYLEFSNSGGTWHQIQGTTLLSSDVSYLIVGSMDATTSRLYVDGALEASGTPGFAPDTTTSMDIAFGKLGAFSQCSSHTHHWGGMWDRALTDSEIASLSAGARPQDIDGLVGYWPAIGEAGVVASGAGTVKDWSGNGNHGTPANSPVYAASPIRIP